MIELDMLVSTSKTRSNESSALPKKHLLTGVNLLRVLFGELNRFLEIAACELTRHARTIFPTSWPFLQILAYQGLGSNGRESRVCTHQPGDIGRASAKLSGF